MSSSSLKKRIGSVFFMFLLIGALSYPLFAYLNGHNMNIAAIFVFITGIAALVILLIVYPYGSVFYTLFTIFLAGIDGLMIYCFIRDFSKPLIATLFFIINVLFGVLFFFRKRYRVDKRGKVKFILEENSGRYVLQILFLGASEEKRADVMNRIRTRYPYREKNGEKVYELSRDQMEYFVDSLVADDEEVRIW